jgi:predicted deacylase
VGGRGTGVKADERPPAAIGGTTVAAGSSATLEIPVARLTTGTWLSLPIGVVHGRRDGPTLWLSATIHGDEIGGVPVIREVVRRLEPWSVAGTLIAAPIVNVFGLVNESRYLPDRRDLNRSFPGSRRGSLAARLAHLFMTEVVERSDLGIDLHTGSDGRRNLPQIRCDLDDPPTRRVAEVFGAPIVLHSRVRDGSLRAAATARGIGVLVYEAGAASRFDSDGIELGVEGILRVMRSRGMLRGGQPRKRRCWISRSRSWARAPRSGFCQLLVRLGQRVSRGQELARVFDALDRGEAQVRSPARGVVIGLLESALVNRGDAVAHVARVDE